MTMSVNATSPTIGNRVDLANRSMSQNNGTLEDDIIVISVYSQITNVVISILTIVFNSVVIHCLRTHRRKLAPVLWYQIMYLCISDLLSGFSPGFVAFTVFPEVNQNTRACVAIIAVFYICQMATITNLALLSFRRFFILRLDTTHLRNASNARKVVKNMFACSWIFSCVYISPILFISSDHDVVNGCMSTRVFKHENYYNVFLQYTIAYMCESTMLLNICYIVLICFLKEKLSRKQNTALEVSSKRVTSSSALDDPSSLSTSSIFSITSIANLHMEILNIKPVSTPRENMTASSWEPQEHKATPCLGPQKNIATTKNMTNSSRRQQENMTTPSRRQHEIMDTPNQRHQENMTTPSRRQQENMATRSRRQQEDMATSTRLHHQHMSHPTGPNLSAEKQALRHLMTILIVTNITIWPNFVINMLVTSGLLPSDPTGTPIIDVHLVSMNSLLNPLMYGFSVEALWSAMKDMARCKKL